MSKISPDRQDYEAAAKDLTYRAYAQDDAALAHNYRLAQAFKLIRIIEEDKPADRLVPFRR